eukprot:5056754-Ditylum_brightwellii.AAC.1
MTMTTILQFWEAEERHQRHDERFKMKKGQHTNDSDEIRTLSLMDWLGEYGRRTKSVWGTGETMDVAPDDTFHTYIDYDDLDDGMARLMI